MEAIRHAANAPPATAGGAQVAELLRLRSLSQRLLAAVGALIALSTLATGTVVGIRRGLAGAPGVEQLSPEVVVVFGGAGSLLAALFYGPAAGAIRGWASA